jgi:hypothetical protein
MTRGKGNEAKRQQAGEKYRDKRKELNAQIFKSKEVAWKRLVEDVDETPWSTGYKINLVNLAEIHHHQVRSWVNMGSGPETFFRHPPARLDKRIIRRGLRIRPEGDRGCGI